MPIPLTWAKCPPFCLVLKTETATMLIFSVAEAQFFSKARPSVY